MYSISIFESQNKKLIFNTFLNSPSMGKNNPAQQSQPLAFMFRICLVELKNTVKASKSCWCARSPERWATITSIGKCISVKYANTIIVRLTAFLTVWVSVRLVGRTVCYWKKKVVFMLDVQRQQEQIQIVFLRGLSLPIGIFLWFFVLFYARILYFFSLHS